MNQEELGLLQTISTNTIAYRLKDWINNFKENVPRVQGGYGVASLLNTLKNVPCIIVGSGPTLDLNIKQLRGLQNRACIITSDSAFRALLDNDIHAHLILTTDSKGKVKEFFSGVDTSKYNFILDTFCHPDTADFIQGRKYWYNTLPVEGCEFTQILNQWTGFIGSLGTGGCVATTIWSLVVQILGCDPDILVGLPEAYYDISKQYADCVTRANHKGIDQYDAPPISMKDIYDRDCFTQPGFRSFSIWFQDAFRHIPGIHINCSEGGIIQKNCLIMNLKDVAERYLINEYPIEEMLFVKEKQIDHILQIAKKEQYSKHRPMLTVLLDGPSLQNLSLRMGLTEQETQDTINELRDNGFDIEETSSDAVNPFGEPMQIVAFTLKGIQVDEIPEGTDIPIIVEDEMNEESGSNMR